MTSQFWSQCPVQWVKATPLYLSTHCYAEQTVREDSLV